MSDVPEPVEGVPYAGEPPGLAGLVRQLAEDSRLLLQQEVALAKLEVGQTAKAIAHSSGFVAGGALFLALGLLVLLVFIVLALGALLGEYWLSALIVGGALAFLGAVLLLTGRKNLRSSHLKPDWTAASLRDTKDWAAEEGRDIKAQLSR